jgi:hypothetical protein
MQEKKTKPVIPVKKGKGISPTSIHLDPVSDIVGELSVIGIKHEIQSMIVGDLRSMSLTDVQISARQYTGVSFSAEKPRIRACSVGCSCAACLYNNCVGHIGP